jgi:hypothetical protein
MMTETYICDRCGASQAKVPMAHLSVVKHAAYYDQSDDLTHVIATVMLCDACMDTIAPAAHEAHLRWWRRRTKEAMTALVAEAETLAREILGVARRIGRRR